MWDCPFHLRASSCWRDFSLLTFSVSENIFVTSWQLQSPLPSYVVLTMLGMWKQSNMTLSLRVQALFLHRGYLLRNLGFRWFSLVFPLEPRKWSHNGHGEPSDAALWPVPLTGARESWFFINATWGTVGAMTDKGWKVPVVMGRAVGRRGPACLAELGTSV